MKISARNIIIQRDISLNKFKRLLVYRRRLTRDLSLTIHHNYSHLNLIMPLTQMIDSSNGIPGFAFFYAFIFTTFSEKCNMHARYEAFIFLNMYIDSIIVCSTIYIYSIYLYVYGSFVLNDRTSVQCKYNNHAAMDKDLRYKYKFDYL